MAHITPAEVAALERARAGTVAAQKKQQPFILRMPLWWALACPKRAMNVGLVLWYKWGLERRRKLPAQANTVKLTTEECTKHGIGRRQKSNSLELLEKAGLITVERRDRRNPVVTLIVDSATSGLPV